MRKSIIHVIKKDFYSVLALALSSLLLFSCATAHIVVGDLAPETKTKLIHEKAKIGQIIKSEGNTYLFTIIKESSFFPDFNQQHLVLTDLDGKPIAREKYDVSGLNRTTGESATLLTGRVIINLLKTVSGLPIFTIGTDEVLNCQLSENHRYMAVTKGGFPSTSVLLYDLEKGALIKTVEAQSEWKDKRKLERRRISGHTINGVIGFTKDALYILSEDPGFASIDSYITKVSLDGYHQSEFDIPDEDHPALGYGDIGIKIYLVNNQYYAIDEGYLKVFDVNENKVVKKYDISKYKGLSSIHYADNDSVVLGMSPLFFQTPSPVKSSECCDIVELKLETNEFKKLFTMDAKNPTFIVDSTGRFDEFGVVTERVGNKYAVGFIDYEKIQFKNYGKTIIFYPELL